jgi:hypothetical protein
MFTVELLPAKRGDCLWIEYGSPAAPRRILIDGGLHETGELLQNRLRKLPEDQRKFTLVVVTHIDLDHIGGILTLLRKPPPGLWIDDIWFNGWDQLAAAHKFVHGDGVLGPRQGEAVDYYIKVREIPHNVQFGGGPVFRSVSEIPAKTLPDGMTVRLFGPTAARLADLLPDWKEKIERLKLEPGGAGETIEQPDEAPEALGVLGDENRIDVLLALPYEVDNSEANGSSIAVLLDFSGKRLLCVGDAFAEDMAAAAQILAAAEGTPRLRVDAIKLSHHGGKKNTSGDFVRTLYCRHWLISTNGSTYGHPDGESLARVVRYAKSDAHCTLYFNYGRGTTPWWHDPDLQLSDGFAAVSPRVGEEGLFIDLESL